MGRSIQPLHEWDMTPAEAAARQQELRGRLCLQAGPDPVKRVAGVDVSFPAALLIVAGLVILTWREDPS